MLGDVLFLCFLVGVGISIFSAVPSLLVLHLLNGVINKFWVCIPKIKMALNWS